jgi:small subunit ribosomal protein S1
MSAESTMPAPSSIDELKPGMSLKGTVKRLELYGAFVDVGLGQDGLLHISQLGKPNVRNVEDVVKVGEEITVYVLKVDREKKQVALSLVKPPAINWDELKEGTVVTGTVVRVENFGVFVDIGAERPGMVHVSELANGYVKSPSDVVKIGQEVQARIIKINRKKRQIDMSIKALEAPVEIIPDDDAADEDVPTAMELALRKAMGQDAVASGKRDKRKRERRFEEQEDIFERTLRNHHSGR